VDDAAVAARLGNATGMPARMAAIAVTDVRATPPATEWRITVAGRASTLLFQAPGDRFSAPSAWRWQVAWGNGAGIGLLDLRNDPVAFEDGTATGQTAPPLLSAPSALPYAAPGFWFQPADVHASFARFGDPQCGPPS
jgi:hypothetical protein